MAFATLRALATRLLGREKNVQALQSEPIGQTASCSTAAMEASIVGTTLRAIDDQSLDELNELSKDIRPWPFWLFLIVEAFSTYSSPQGGMTWTCSLEAAADILQALRAKGVDASFRHLMECADRHHEQPYAYPFLPKDDVINKLIDAEGELERRELNQVADVVMAQTAEPAQPRPRARL
ncbi:hypothetical protein [Burkholderia vietnamiensis]|uniref:hypothetical protein n=1 Tax=Burkholderia vietnamiensis TaxID=60552 RepID=UPI001CF263A7|nr:hypothetical protein [Burkholderia vietnamiensis]MCA8448934.1 hypothetical protein [Burkholderia vietnamiensis]